MSDPMPPELRESLIALAMAEGPARLLDRLQAFQGIDLAGLPFRLLDRLLATGAEGDPAALARLAPLLPGGQPRLFAAICDGLAHSDTAALERLRADPAAHRMTRWEATGWAVFLRHRGPLPGQPVARIMQFWDRAEPPADVDRAMAGWDHLGPVVRRCNRICFGCIGCWKPVGPMSMPMVWPSRGRRPCWRRRRVGGWWPPR